MPRRPAADRFDASYYRRFYEDPRTRVADRSTTRRLGAFVGAYLRFLEVEVDSVLDLGCGLGWWQPVANKLRASYRGVEVSPHLCEAHGWMQGSVVDFPGPGADLVVCQGVLQYLPAREAQKALTNLARLTYGALYLEVLTREDWDENVSRDRTDGDVYFRGVDWYRSRLRKRFVAAGGGVFLPRDGASATLYALEKLE
ncbi:MAG: class I SAM-dependent methyltransferase [Myxococcota bacterium]